MPPKTVGRLVACRPGLQLVPIRHRALVRWPHLAAGAQRLHQQIKNSCENTIFCLVFRFLVIGTQPKPQEQRYRRLMAERKGVQDAHMLEFRWLLEELRVSFFAQELRTPQPVSI